jgi:hypothetical protein
VGRGPLGLMRCIDCSLLLEFRCHGSNYACGPTPQQVVGGGLARSSPTSIGRPVKKERKSCSSTYFAM